LSALIDWEWARLSAWEDYKKQFPEYAELLGKAVYFDIFEQEVPRPHY
jgi:hypothetical protein